MSQTISSLMLLFVKCSTSCSGHHHKSAQLFFSDKILFFAAILDRFFES